MLFEVGDLVIMRQDAAKPHMNFGGHGEYLLRHGVVVNTRTHKEVHYEHYELEMVTVKFMCDEAPIEWLASDFRRKEAEE